MRLNPKVFEKAAELVEREHEFCCIAIRRSLFLFHTEGRCKKYLYYFAERFRPAHLPMKCVWFGSPFDSENQQTRARMLRRCAELLRQEQSNGFFNKIKIYYKSKGW